MAKTYKKISEDGTVENEDEVVIEISEPTISKRNVTLRQLRGERDADQKRLESYQVSVADYDTQISLAETEAKKVVLKTKE